IGQAVATRARGFRMRVLYTQRHPLEPAKELALGVRYASLDELVAESDFVSLHAPLNADTRGMFSRRLLSRMKKDSVLINTARGALVDEEALAEALVRGPLAAAGLDVYEREPLVHPKLLALPNVVLAPHLGSADRPTREAMAETAAENVLR